MKIVVAEALGVHAAFVSSEFIATTVTSKMHYGFATVIVVLHAQLADSGIFDLFC
jgi:hypothetical protein